MKNFIIFCHVTWECMSSESKLLMVNYRLEQRTYVKMDEGVIF